MLFFLHNKLSVPANAPDSASCTGYVGAGNYNQIVVPINSSTTWNYMLNNSINDKGCYSAAILIADVGKRVGVVYGNGESSASMWDLPNTVFSAYGISCILATTYSTSTINQSLRNGMPIIIRADGFPNGTDGHCFIIDGYRRYWVVYTYQYEWVWDEPAPGPPFFNYPPYNVVTYGSPYITDYRMNWGWGGLHNADYFAVSGNWIVDDDNFIYNRSYLYNFEVI